MGKSGYTEEDARLGVMYEAEGLTDNIFQEEGPVRQLAMLPTWFYQVLLAAGLIVLVAIGVVNLGWESLFIS